MWMTSDLGCGMVRVWNMGPILPFFNGKTGAFNHQHFVVTVFLKHPLGHFCSV